MFWILLPSFILLDLIWWYIADRRLRVLRRARLWRSIAALFTVSMVVYLLLTMFWATPLRRSGGLPVGVHAFIYLWHFIALPMLAIYYVARPGWRLIRRKRPRLALKTTQVSRGFPLADMHGGKCVEAGDIAGGDSSSLTGGPSPQPSPLRTGEREPTRRQILAAAAFTLPPVATALATGWSVSTLSDRRLRRFTLRLKGLPRQLDGMTIAHVSDTHIGKFFSPDWLPAIAEEVNRLDADFVAFTGDLIDLAMDDLPYGIDFLRSLKSRCGLVVCEGNHDIMQNRGDFEFAMQDAGLPLILGNQQTLPFVSRDGQHFPVQFLAVPWNMTDGEMGEAVQFLMPQVNTEAFPILLAHHPHSFDKAAEMGLPLTLSGHTHGGQIMLTSQVGLGRLRFRYTSGLYQRNHSSLIVNNGIGNWFPLRINAPAELVHITLRSV